MSKRDPVTEVLEVKTREGRRTWVLPRAHGVSDLATLWGKRDGALRTVADYFPVRAVTLIEVFAKRWLERLIDHGEPYATNAAGLERTTIKLDFASSAAIQGRRVSLGQLVAHSVSLSRPEQIAACFTQVIGQDFFGAIERTHDHFAVERTGAPQIPIIADPSQMRKALIRLFVVRHILVHETPGTRPYTDDDLDEFLAAGAEFCRATDETLLNILHPNHPLTTRDMVDEATVAYGAARQQLDEMVAKVGPAASIDPDLLRRSHEAWATYAKLQAELRSSHLAGGSLQPLIYAQEAERLARVRTDDLRWWLEREEGEL